MGNVNRVMPIVKMARRILARFLSGKQQTTALRPIPLNQVGQYMEYQIGDWTYGDPRILSWGEGSKLIIGRYCSLASCTILLGGEHHTDWVTTYPFNIMFEEGHQYIGHPRTKGDVVIGNDVWIGHEALILSGVRIGDGAVIAARSVVTKDVAPYAIVAGNPAHLVKFRFAHEVIQSLREIAWWNWPAAKVKDALPLLLSVQIEEFITRYRNSEPGNKDDSGSKLPLQD